jgi:hypothetical protein
MTSYAKMNYLPRGVFHYYEGIKLAEEKIGYCKKIAGPDLAGVIAKEGTPILGWCSSRTSFTQIFPNCALRNGNAELEEFAPYPLSTPKRIFFSHLFDQSNRIFTDLWLRLFGSGFELQE